MKMAINVEPDSRTLSSSVAWPLKSHYMRKSVFRDLRLTDSFTARNRVVYTCQSLHCYLNTMLSRVHLAFHARIQDFSSGGGGGGSSSIWQKSPDDVFFSPQLILLKSNGLFRRKLSFFKVPEGVQHFPRVGGGSNFFQGVWLLIPYRNPYNLWLPPDPSGSALAISTCRI